MKKILSAIATAGILGTFLAGFAPSAMARNVDWTISVSSGGGYAGPAVVHAPAPVIVHRPPVRVAHPGYHQAGPRHPAYRHGWQHQHRYDRHHRHDRHHHRHHR